MTFKGDIKEIGLTDLFQTLESNRKSGVLTIDPEGKAPPWKVAFMEGTIVAIAREGGLALEPADVLVQWGMVEEKAGREVLRRWNRARKKTLGRILLDQGLLSREDYCGLVVKLLEEEALLVLSQEKAFYAFREGTPDLHDFDPEHLWAEPRLDPGPLLLEAARREDEWRRIRRNVAGESDLFLALEAEDGSLPEAEVPLQVYQALDGRSDFGDLAASLPLTRFELAGALSALVEEGWARPAGPEELAHIAQLHLEEGEIEAGLARLRRALERHTHHTSLRIMLADALEGAERLREAAGELALAAQELEAAEEFQRADELLQRAVACSPEDPNLRARRLRLSLLFDEPLEVRDQGLELADLYLTLGVAGNARKVIMRLLRIESLDGDEELLRKLAQVESASGRAAEAIAILNRLAGKAWKMERVEAALSLYEEILAMDPGHKAALKGLQGIHSGLRRRRRRRIKRYVGTALFSALGCCAFIYLLHEVTGLFMLDRFHDYALEYTILGRPAAAIRQGEVVAASHPLSFAGDAAARKARKLARLQLLHLESLVNTERVGEAAAAMVLLDEQAGHYLARREWWPLAGRILESCITRDVPNSGRRTVAWAMSRLTGLPDRPIQGWFSWWLEKGVKLHARAEAEGSQPAVSPPR